MAFLNLLYNNGITMKIFPYLIRIASVVIFCCMPIMSMAEPLDTGLMNDDMLAEVTALGEAASPASDTAFGVNWQGFTAGGQAIEVKGTGLASVASAAGNISPQIYNHSSVSLSGNAQQNLKALVSVNAAQSLVQVMLNLNININSPMGSVQQSLASLSNR
ncbi:MAG: hypothetical protein ACOYK8_06895 [Alphaproteobacteria bacterium]